MFNPKILKKMKEDTEVSKDIKSMSKHAMKTMEPEMEEKEEDDMEEKYPKKGMAPEAKLEIEIMLQSAKKKKK